MAQHMIPFCAVCTATEVRFPSLSHLLTHVRDIHLKISPYRCSLCDFSAPGNEVVFEHAKESHPEAIDDANADFVISFNERGTRGEVYELVRRSYEKATGCEPSERPLRCPEEGCLEELADVDEFICHHREHVAEVVYQCRRCAKKMEKEDLREHLSSSHAIVVGEEESVAVYGISIPLPATQQSVEHMETKLWNVFTQMAEEARAEQMEIFGDAAEPNNDGVANEERDANDERAHLVNDGEVDHFPDDGGHEEIPADANEHNNEERMDEGEFQGEVEDEAEGQASSDVDQANPSTPVRQAPKRKRTRRHNVTVKRTKQVIVYEHKVPKPAESANALQLLLNINRYFEEMVIHDFVKNEVLTVVQIGDVSTEADLKERIRRTIVGQSNKRRSDISDRAEKYPVSAVSFRDGKRRLPKLLPGFTYIARNDKSNCESIRTSEKSMKIKCKCQGKICGTNCPCWKASIEHGQAMILGDSIVRFSSDFSTSFVVACGSACSCKGKCTNSVKAKPLMSSLQVVEKKNGRHGIRSTEAIPVGKIVTEMCGELREVDRNEKQETANVWKLCQLKNDSFRKLIQKWRSYTIEKTTVLDLSRQGNICRYAQRSEWPNVMGIKVAENDLRPGSMRLLMVACRPILPDQEIFLDFGEGRRNPSKCRCDAKCKAGLRLLKNMGEINATKFLLEQQRSQAKKMGKIRERDLKSEEEQRLIGAFEHFSARNWE